MARIGTKSKSKAVPISPEAVENLGRMSHAEIQALSAGYLTRQFVEAEQRTARASRARSDAQAAQGDAPPLSNTGGK